MPIYTGAVLAVIAWLLEYSYLCNQCLSPLMLSIRISNGARCTTLCDKVCQWLATDWWFSPGSPISTTNNTWPSDRTEILLKVAGTPLSKHIQSASGPLTHLMSLHSVRGSIVIHIHKEGVMRSQSVCKPLPYGPMTGVSVQKVFVNPLSHGPMTMVCVYKVFVKPLSYDPMPRVSFQKVFVNPLSYGPMTMICVHKVLVKPLSYGPMTRVSVQKVFVNPCHTVPWQWSVSRKCL